MTTLTVHSPDPEIERKIREKARREGKSLNRVMKELLAQSTGVDKSQKAARRTEFDEFAGIWSEEDEAEFDEATADFEKLNEEDWR